MQLQRRRAPKGSLWKQLEQPAHRDALVATYGAEGTLSLALELMQRERNATTRANFGCLGYVAFFFSWFVFAGFGLYLSAVFPILTILFSPVVLVILLKMNKEQTVRRLNLLWLLRLSVRGLTDSTKAPELIRAIRSVGILEDPVLRRELRQELGRLLLRLPVAQAQKLTRLERLYLRAWLWEAMKWDQAGDTEFCLAVLLTLGDAKDRSAWPHALLCARWHHNPRVREAARACMDELRSS